MKSDLPDYAIVAGISRYPDKGLGSLRGCENDARAFRDWVTTVGGVDKKDGRLSFIVSSEFPDAATPADARPDEAALERAFRDLHDRARASYKADLGWTIGRRLYIYLAGHGFVPSWQAQNRILALLTANACEGSPNHLAAPLYWRWARDAAVFEEVLLFMDCCASTDYEVGLRPVPFVIPKIPVGPANGRLFYAAASKPGFKTREKTVEHGGIPRGVFTLTLLEALSGAAAKDSCITNLSLTSYLTEQMQRHLDPADLKDDEISKAADGDYEPKTEFVLFKNVKPTQYGTMFRVSSRFEGHELTIWAGEDLCFVTTARDRRVISLPAGSYLARVSGAEFAFEVPARGNRVDL